MSTTAKKTAGIPHALHTRKGNKSSRWLAEVLREQLRCGEYNPGDRLPTHRQLMQQFDVGYSVANRAMEILANEGLIQRHQGQGSFVSEKTSDTTEAASLDAFALVLGHPRWSFYQSLFQGLDTTAANLHCQMIVCDTENDLDRQATVFMQLIDKRVAGIALVPTTEVETPGYQIRLCQQIGIPVVLLHRNVKGVSAPVIALPFEDIGYLAGKTLVEQGHRRVALVFDERYVATEQYEAGLRQALGKSSDGMGKLSIHCSGQRPIPMTPEHEKFLEEMLDGILDLPAAERPTAIMAIADDDAEWIYLRLIKLGVRVPQEVSLITVGSTIRHRVLDQQLSAVTIDEQGVGQLAAKLLSEIGRGVRPIDNSERFTAALDFHIGQTLGPPTNGQSCGK